MDDRETEPGRPCRCGSGYEIRPYREWAAERDAEED